MSLRILDSTLREGEQTPGVFFQPEQKMEIARMLDDVGVDIIEAGHPRVSPSVKSSLERIASSGLDAIVAAHARSTRSDVDLAVNSGAGFTGIFYSINGNRLKTNFGKTLDQAIGSIRESVSYARERSPDALIRYTPEDTVRSDFDDVVRAASAALASGANIISVADTTGSLSPAETRAYIRDLRSALEHMGDHEIEYHGHNDRGLALANSLAAYEGGATILDASVLGLGERAGITDLAQLLVNLQHFEGAGEWNLDALDALYDYVSDASGVPIPRNYPLMGEHAFTHCAGVHTNAAVVDPGLYETVRPEWLGRDREICLDHMAGVSAVKYHLDALEIDYDESLVKDVLGYVKERGEMGERTYPAQLPGIVESYERRETA